MAAPPPRRGPACHGPPFRPARPCAAPDHLRTDPVKFFVSCAKGLEYLLADELSALGLQATATIAGVNADGELAQALRIVMWSRLASRVLWPIDEFDCPDEQALYDGVCTAVARAHLAGDDPGGGCARVRRQDHPCTLCRAAIKDAIVDRMRDEGLERPSVNTDLPDVRVNLSLRKGRASVDRPRRWPAASPRLARCRPRGAAEENLAAALLRAQWPRLHAAGGGLLDPMCGSGTLLIETR